MMGSVLVAVLFWVPTNISELKAQILGPNDLYVKSGSQIIINCKLTQGPHDLGSILWYKGKC